MGGESGGEMTLKASPLNSRRSARPAETATDKVNAPWRGAPMFPQRLGDPSRVLFLCASKTVGASCDVPTAIERGRFQRPNPLNPCHPWSERKSVPSVAALHPPISEVAVPFAVPSVTAALLFFQGVLAAEDVELVDDAEHLIGISRCC